MRSSTNKRINRIFLTALLVVACAGLARLGVWQLQRAAEKHARYAAFAERHHGAPINFHAIAEATPLTANLWRKTRIRGHFLELYVLLDNRVWRGQPGYEVLTPFSSDDGRTVLINRGWVPLPADRKAEPDVLAPSDPTTVTGYIGNEPTIGISLGKTAAEAEILSPQMFRVQSVDLAGVSTLLHLPLWQGVVYLDANALGALAVDWPMPGDDSGRSRAYAVQWFAMAIVLAGLGLWNLYGRRRT